MKPVVRFDNVSKRFILHRERPRSFQDLVLNRLRRQNGRREVFWALRDINLEIEEGEMVGVIGPNGAGKSTMLKLMTRILEPTSGRISIQGRVAALLELGTGFHPDLTGRENVFLNGSLFGFSNRQMAERLASIVEFSGMERFIDVPVRHYSSGMYMRLAFAVAVHTDPDILITDEVLAVGDEAFQTKCLEKMSAYRDRGVTVILVSHALPVVRRLCGRVIWLQQGSIVMQGTADEVVDAYTADVVAREKAYRREGRLALPGVAGATAIDGLADVRILGCEMVAPGGETRWRMVGGERMALRLHYQVREDLPDAVVTLQIHDAEDQALICGYNSCDEEIAVPLRAGTGAVDLQNIALPLRRGRYLLSVALFRRPDPAAWANPDDLQYQAYTFDVESPLLSPQRRWGTGEALLDRVMLRGKTGHEQTEFETGEPMSIDLRCISTVAMTEEPMLRVQMFDSKGILCHATNTVRAGLHLGRLDVARDVTLSYDHLDLLEGDYVLSVGLWPAETARLPYDWHESAYRFHVRSEHRHGGGLLALSHNWAISD